MKLPERNIPKYLQIRSAQLISNEAIKTLRAKEKEPINQKKIQIEN